VKKPEKAYRDASARDAFAKVKGVDTVRVLEGEDGEVKLEVLPAGKDDLRAELFKAAVDGGLTLLELRQHTQNLEQIFRDLTLTAPVADEDEDEDEDDEEEEKKPASKASAKDDEDEDEDEGSSKSSSDKEKE
jgi:hypothetical protein